MELLSGVPPSFVLKMHEYDDEETYASDKMKQNRLLKSIILAAAPVGGLISEGHSAVISVNYGTSTSTTPAMGAADVAGVISVANWNNVVDGDHLVSFGDVSGIATSLGVSVSGGGGNSWNRLDPAAGRIFSDKITMGGVGLIKLTTVPYDLYDVYIYLSDWGAEVINFSLDGGVATVGSLTNATGGFDGVYVENDNYVKLSGLSGDSSITMTATTGEVHLAAFQVVQIPEPGAAFLGGLGVLALLRRRRS